MFENRYIIDLQLLFLKYFFLLFKFVTYIKFSNFRVGIFIKVCCTEIEENLVLISKAHLRETGNEMSKTNN